MNIFLSRPNWIDPTFEPGLNTFLTQISNLGLTPRTLGVSDYPSKAPLDEVIDILGSCNGAIILGVPQIEIRTGLIKGEEIGKPIVLGTEWNQLEAGLAYAAGLPLLVIHHNSVTRGIFDRGVLNAFLHQVDLSKNNWSMHPSINGALVQWKDKCLNGRANFQQNNKAAALPGKPICPNCSTKQSPIYMKPVGHDFINLLNANWDCPKCGYAEMILDKR